MRASSLLALLLAYALASLTGAASQAPPAKKVDDGGGAYEIDFSPLPGLEGTTEYKLHIVTHARSGIIYKETFTIEGVSAKSVRDTIKRSYESVDWSVRAEGDTRLTVEGLNGSPVVKMEVKVEGLPENRTPKVKRLEKKEK
jgi:hypothetical protein